MFDSIRVVGRGRVGSAIAARLHERGVAIRDDRRGSGAALRARRRDPRRGARASTRAPGSRTSAAPPRSPRSIRTSAASVFIRCRPSRGRGGPNNSTAPGPRSSPRPTPPGRGRGGWRRLLGPSPLRPRRTTCGPCTTPAPRSPPTTSSPSTARRRTIVRSSRRAARGAAAADAPDHRQRVRAHGTDRPRRLVHRRRPPGCDSPARAGTGSRCTGRSPR